MLENRRGKKRIYLITEVEASSHEKVLMWILGEGYGGPGEHIVTHYGHASEVPLLQTAYALNEIQFNLKNEKTIDMVMIPNPTTCPLFLNIVEVCAQASAPVVGFIERIENIPLDAERAALLSHVFVPNELMANLLYNQMIRQGMSDEEAQKITVGWPVSTEIKPRPCDMGGVDVYWEVNSFVEDMVAVGMKTLDKWDFDDLYIQTPLSIYSGARYNAAAIDALAMGRLPIMPFNDENAAIVGAYADKLLYTDLEKLHGHLSDNSMWTMKPDRPTCRPRPNPSEILGNYAERMNDAITETIAQLFKQIDGGP